MKASRPWGFVRADVGVLLAVAPGAGRSIPGGTTFPAEAGIALRLGLGRGWVQPVLGAAFCAPTAVPTSGVQVSHDQRRGYVWLDRADPTLPVGQWFHLEAFYRNAPHSYGHIALWLDGRQLVEAARPTAPNLWTGWEVVSAARNLDPADATLYVDDCAISQRRVGPDGVLVR